MHRRKFMKDDSAEREHFRRELDDVGKNLPDDAPGVEGSDVGDVVRHHNGIESVDTRIARELANPHPDIETELSKGVHLVKDDEESDD